MTRHTKIPYNFSISVLACAVFSLFGGMRMIGACRDGVQELRPAARLATGIYGRHDEQLGRLLLIIGREGTGKTEQAALLAELMGVVKVGTGDLIRSVESPHTDYDHHLVSRLEPEEIEALKGREPGSPAANGTARKLFVARVSCDDCIGGAVLEGVPRLRTQVDWPEDMARQNSFGIDVVELIADDEVLIPRVTGRRICSPCRAVYHIVHKQPKVDNTCDHCHRQLVHRVEDTEKTLRERWAKIADDLDWLGMYYSQRNALYRISAAGSPKDTCQRVLDALKY